MPGIQILKICRKKSTKGLKLGYTSVPLGNGLSCSVNGFEVGAAIKIYDSGPKKGIAVVSITNIFQVALLLLLTIFIQIAKVARPEKNINKLNFKFSDIVFSNPVKSISHDGYGPFSDQNNPVTTTAYTNQFSKPIFLQTLLI